MRPESEFLRTRPFHIELHRRAMALAGQCFDKWTDDDAFYELTMELAESLHFEYGNPTEEFNHVDEEVSGAVEDMFTDELYKHIALKFMEATLIGRPYKKGKHRVGK